METVSQIFPMFNPARLGQSPQRAALLRSLPTSYSFIRQPLVFQATAARALIKLGLGSTLTPVERLAARMALRFAGGLMAASVASAVVDAQLRGKDKTDAMWAVSNPDPTNGRFLTLTLGSVRIPLGGPYRAMFRAIYGTFHPEGYQHGLSQIPLVRFARNRINPFLSTQLELARNEDYYGRKILQGNVMEQIGQFVAHEMRGNAPLALQEIVESQRGDVGLAQGASNVIGQFLGVPAAPAIALPTKMGEFERLGRLPPIDSPLAELRVAWKQAGEGRLSPEAKRAWRDYEWETPDGKRGILLSVPREVALELRIAERYRELRRKELARNFPALDVWLVEDAWQATPRGRYMGVTPAGRKRYAELRRRS
jgi:hypothetical protein